MTRCLVFLLWTAAQFGSSNTGELRLSVTDPSGLPLQSAVELVSEANQLVKTLETDPQATLSAKRRPYWRYRVEVSRDGFATFAGLLDVQSALPTEYHVTLTLA